MLKGKNQSKYPIHRFFAILIIISSITFHYPVHADIKNEIAESYRIKGYELQQKGKLNDALTFYSKAITLGAENATLLNDMAIIYEKLNLPIKAEGLYLRAVELDPSYLPAYANLAYLYKSQGRINKAVQFFRRRYELSGPNDSWADKAREELLNLDPSYNDAVQAREVQTLQKEVIDEAHQQFVQKVTKSREHFNAGENHFRRRKYHEAVKEYNQALRLNPRDKGAISSRQKALREISKENFIKGTEEAVKKMEQGNTVAARSELQKVLSTLPNNNLSNPE